MPLVDTNRTLRLAAEGSRFRVPAGFSVEEVAAHDLTGSLICMTFDHLGRPVVSAEGDGRGLFILLDPDGDGRFDAMHSYAPQVQNAQGMHFIAPGDLLVNAHGEQGAGLYRLQDLNLDDTIDHVTMLVPSQGGIGEHGPHAIQTGFDGHYYIMYGNHAHPKYPIETGSPLRNYAEDVLLPRYVDPRGHATSVMAPGGTLVRLSPDFQHLSEVSGGFRNAYDFDLDVLGEMFTFDSDMEWDFGAPWFRPVRVVHAVPGGDYGWRTGSSKHPDYHLDLLPPVDDVGRGSPVGVSVYHHHVYPERYHGAVFLGDWSRGRIRVLMPKGAGATYAGETVDFVVGEPLNVTDMDVAPDGLLYFCVGGRRTQGGLYRVRYDHPGGGDTGVRDSIERVLTQPMHRSAWGRERVREAMQNLDDGADAALRAAVLDVARPAPQRLQGLEILQRRGTADLDLIRALAADTKAELRAAAVLLFGTHPWGESAGILAACLEDSDPLVLRRACEALVRAGLSPENSRKAGVLDGLIRLAGHPDRFVRYAARLGLERADREAWAPRVLRAEPAAETVRVLEGLVALVRTAACPADYEAVQQALASMATLELDDAVLLMYLRTFGLAVARCAQAGEAAGDDWPCPETRVLAETLGPRLLARFPAADARVNRELQVMLAHFGTPGAIEALLAHLDRGLSQEEEIHTVYCLRVIQDGWTTETRGQLVAWFDRGREMGGGASLEGFINNLWDSSLAHFPEPERLAAETRKAEALRKRQEEALALLEGGDLTQGVNSELAQMSFEELSEYLEYDPMAYRDPNLEHGHQVFMRAKCASCHVFGSIGKGGGPDLSTVTSRFRRRDILEAIMYPSRVVSDQYIGLEIELGDFTILTGMAVAENENILTIITVDGQRMEIPTDEIVSRKAAEGSIMPEGLLNAMSLGELVSLINFLEQGGGL